MAPPTKDHVLMLNGGGKDTIVAAELLRRSQQDFTWLTIRPSEVQRKVIQLSGNPRSIEVRFTIDDDLDRLRAFSWAHFPHTAMVLSIGLLVALLTGYRYVAAGNEYSASFGNLRYRGREVNHQYTKSYEFEAGFSAFVERAVTRTVKVFSILRPFHDLQLAQLFARETQYRGHFLSCNRGFRRGSWCNECPKCAFMALALYPFVTRDTIRGIFGEDIVERPVIRRHILDLVSGPVKPWECVGTRDECALALALMLERHPDVHFNGAPTRRALERAIASTDVPGLQAALLGATQEAHSIPAPLVDRLNRGLEQIGAPLIRTASSLPHDGARR